MPARRAVAPAVIAPGKVFLAGEWSVLGGGWCLVSTVKVFARARLVPAGEDDPRARDFVSAILKADGRPVPSVLSGGRSRISLDVDEFMRGTTKMGLGSSAAGTAAVVGLLEVIGKGRIGPRERLAARCAAVHRALQGGDGSGADAFASVKGGIVRFRMPSTARRCSPAGRFPMIAIGLGAGGTRTSRMLAMHREMRDAGDPRLLSNMGVFGEAAGGIIDGIERGEWHTLRTGVNVASAAYEELGDILGAELVTAADRMVMRHTRLSGGVSRPTGAGGGDLHLAYFEGEASALRFSAWARERGLVVVPIDPDPVGVRRYHPI